MSAPLLQAFGEELAGVLTALVGSPTNATTVPTPVNGEVWTATVSADAPGRGAWTLHVGAAGARAVTNEIMGLTDEDPAPPPAVADTLREAFSQALSALCLKDVARGVTLKLGELKAVPDAGSVAARTTLSLQCGTNPTPFVVSVTGAIELGAANGAAAGAPAAAARPASSAPGSGASPSAAAGTGPAPDRLDAILDIELPLIVRFGRTELPLKMLASLGPGSLIDLGRSADDPVDLLVSNRVVARGEVVVVGGNYGVRVLDVVSPRERARSMEA